MPTEGPRRPWFEVDPHCEPIAGRMHVGGEPPHSFTSWLELIALIEQTRAPAAAARGARRQGPSPRCAHGSNRGVTRKDESQARRSPARGTTVRPPSPKLVATIRDRRPPHKEESMKDKFARKRSIPSLALLGVFAAAGVGYAAIPSADDVIGCARRDGAERNGWEDPQ